MFDALTDRALTHTEDDGGFYRSRIVGNGHGITKLFLGRLSSSIDA